MAYLTVHVLGNVVTSRLGNERVLSHETTLLVRHVSHSASHVTGDVVTSRLGNGRAGIKKVLQMDLSSAMLQRSQTRMQVSHWTLT